MAEEPIVALSAKTYDGFVAEVKDCIILVHKTLCPHCTIMGTVLAKLKAQQPDIAMASVDSEREPELVARLEAERVPTLCILRDGAVKARRQGILNPREVAALYQNA